MDTFFITPLKKANIPWKNPAHCFPFAKKIKKIKKNRELDG